MFGKRIAEPLESNFILNHYLGDLYDSECELCCFQNEKHCPTWRKCEHENAYYIHKDSIILPLDLLTLNF